MPSARQMPAIHQTLSHLMLTAALWWSILPSCPFCRGGCLEKLCMELNKNNNPHTTEWGLNFRPLEPRIRAFCLDFCSKFHLSSPEGWNMELIEPSVKAPCTDERNFWPDSKCELSTVTHPVALTRLLLWPPPELGLVFPSPLHLDTWHVSPSCLSQLVSLVSVFAMFSFPEHPAPPSWPTLA